MIVNKISINNASSLNFGRLKKTNKADNSVNTNNNKKKKIMLTLGALAATGLVIAAVKNPEISSKLRSVKGQLFSHKSTEKISDATKTNAYAAGAAAMVSTAVIATQAEKQKEIQIEVPQPNVDAEDKTPAITEPTTDMSLKDTNSEELIVPNTAEETAEEIRKEAPIVETAENNDADIEQTDVNPIEIEEVTDTEPKEEETDEFTLADFKKAKGEFFKGTAYIDDEPYTGTLTVNKDRYKYLINYEDGNLVQVTKKYKIPSGKYEPTEIKTYYTEDDGTSVIEIEKRNFSGINGKIYSDDWEKQQKIYINDSEVVILDKNHFGSYLETCYKKQKDGSWRGFYEAIELNPKKQRYEAVPRDVETGNKLSRWQMRRMFR